MALAAFEGLHGILWGPIDTEVVLIVELLIGAAWLLMLFALDLSISSSSCTDDGR